MKSLTQEALLKRVLGKMKGLTESDLTEVEMFIDLLFNAKLESFMNEFTLAVGADRPPLTLAKRSRRGSAESTPKVASGVRKKPEFRLKK
ncbi:hypothetical protein [Leptospira mayottensis]|uniref:hypothetical protein n=1 Tax=Leptospira mayottensis TaxID=1137606 RepID=UPI0002BF1895|nr:hypothetical protein [Leptospira mayottensis]AXR59377.1 hypothetical protein DQM68_00175 [Leptospira mayottensis]AZQ01310.1 hypothetical protein LEP1GSC190_03825 [Leptospira mayottensis 200901116]TGM95055.1 hypothetical protein EHR03_17665 [Leptospira mayottensis]